MQLRSRLYGAFAINILIILVVCSIAINQISSIDAASRRLEVHSITKILHVQDLSDTIREYRILQANHVAANLNRERSLVESRMSALESDMTRLLASYRADMNSDVERDGVDRVQHQWESLVFESQLVLLPNSRLNNDDLALTVFTQQESRYLMVLDALDQLVALAKKELQATQQTMTTIVETTRNLLYGLTIGAIALAIMFSMTLARILTSGVERLLAATQAVAAGDLNHTLDMPGQDELATLGRSFTTMQESLRQARTQIDTQQAELAQRATELEQTLADLQASAQARAQLQEAVNTLESPIVPVLSGVLVMPLIGAIDQQRAQQVLQVALQAISKHRARILILDVTGIPVVDTLVAHALIQVADSTRLLGAQPVLVGLRPELAQTIVGLGIDLSRLVTRSDLQSSVEYALRRVGQETQRNGTGEHNARQ